MFIFGFATGAALAAAASWFYYTHALAARVEAAVAQVRTAVDTAARKV